MHKHIVVIGAGIIGLATAYKLLLNQHAKEVTILEKESEIAQHQSSRNSGVLHAGLYYKPGSLKAILATSGIKEMIQFCIENDIKHDICGKIVVASKESELETLNQLYENGMTNGLTGLKKLDREEMQIREPFVEGIAALLVPEEGVVNYEEVCTKLRHLIIEMGGVIRTKFQVTKATYNKKWSIESKNDDHITADFMINCAGLYSDRIAKIFGVQSNITIIPFRGHYYRVVGQAQNYVKGLVYPVPDPKFPFLGVHFHKKIDGSTEAGPNAVLAFSREGYKMSTIKFSELYESIFHPGLFKFLMRNKKTVFDELRSGIDKTYFTSRLKSLIPKIEPSDLTVGGSGVRAQAMDQNGNLVNDFVINKSENSLHVINAPSPGATASLAIASYIINQLPE